MVFSTLGQIDVDANAKTENNTKLMPNRLGTAIINRRRT
jgi:hypothetical protein